MRKTMTSFLALVCLISCRRAKEASPPTLSAIKHDTAEIYSLASGSALLLSCSGQLCSLYVLAGSHAAAVGGAPSSGIPDIYPAADGTAYLLYPGTDAAEVYHVRGQHCVKVTETNQIAQVTPGADLGGFAWALREAEMSRAIRQRRAEAREEEEAKAEYEANK